MPHPVDVHVGHRIRLKRQLLGMSQDALADKLGLTFQQVQKYEKGVNRVSASRLLDIASALNVPILFFFEDVPGDLCGPVETPSAIPTTNKETVALIRHHDLI